MDAHGLIQRIVAIFAIVLAFGSPALADLTLIYGGSFDLPIPAEPNTGKAWMHDAVIDIPDHLTVIDLDVGITLTHTKVFDLQLFLESPDRTRLCLNWYNLSDEYFDGQNYIQTIFDDEAALPIEQADAPFTGRFRPRADSTLEVFDGQDAYGAWRLQIYDAFYGDTGKLQEFKLFIAIPEPATLVFLMAGACILRSRKPRK